MMRKLRLSIVDAAPVIIGSTRSNSYQNSIDLAKHVEALGYGIILFYNNIIL